MKILFQLIFVLSFTSCASWRAEETSIVSTFPETIKSEVKLPNVSISLKRYDFFDGEKLDKDEMTEEQRLEILKSIETIYSESKLFNLVDIDSPNKDMSIEVNVSRKVKSSTFFSVLTAMTLYLIPRRVIEEITITTRFLDRRGELVGMVEKNDSIITWHQLFMLFVLPFGPPGSVKHETILDLNRSTILEAHSDSYFIDINN